MIILRMAVDVQNVFPNDEVDRVFRPLGSQIR